MSMNIRWAGRRDTKGTDTRDRYRRQAGYETTLNRHQCSPGRARTTGGATLRWWRRWITRARLGHGRSGVRARGTGRSDAPREAVAAAAGGNLREHPGHRGRHAASCEETTADLIRPHLDVVASRAPEKRDGWGGQVAAVKEMPELVTES